MKTALLYKFRELSKDEIKTNKRDIAASYQEAIIKSLLQQLTKVISITGIKQISIVGGVAANKRFRKLSEQLKDDLITEIYFPKSEYCTDNAAMIAIAGYEKLKKGMYSPLSLKANPNLPLNDGAIE